MISCADFLDKIGLLGIDFVTGVPDSTLKDFCAYVTETLPRESHVIAANEGGAMAIAAGRFLATGKPCLVYMQNSGLGNAANPLVSLTDPLVYRIPALLVIGYRGEPGGRKDEPQHAKQGRITLRFLETLGIEHEVLPDTAEGIDSSFERAGAELKKGHVYAFVARPGVFEEYETSVRGTVEQGIGREEAIIVAASEIKGNSVIVSTTGKISRELYEYRERCCASHDIDFLTVGSMGHASQIALGIALSAPGKKIFCFDGDGAFIMHMGGLAITGQTRPANFRHIVFNNGAHESVGGQPSAGFGIDIPGIAKACGYKSATRVRDRAGLVQAIRSLIDSEGPSLLEIVVSIGSRKDLGRPKHTPEEIKTLFMDSLR